MAAGGPMPPGIPGHVIVTTRRGGFDCPGRGPGPGCDQPAGGGARCCGPGCPAWPKAPGTEIAGELGRLPLALEQAAAYLDRAAMPAGDYLGLLRSRAAELYARGQVSGAR